MKKLLGLLKLCALGALVGVAGGVAGAAFAHVLSLVTQTRQGAPWLMIFLPFAAMLTWYLYRVFSMQDHDSPNYPQTHKH